MLKDYPPLLQKCSESIEAWRKTLQAFDQFTVQNVKGCFFHMKMKVMLRILHHLSEENKLSIYDERIFEYFQHLMYHYQITIELFYNNEENIKTGKAKEILSGICVVLSSQLKQFRENQMVEQGIIDPRSNGNPIKIEKDRFLTEQKINILNQLEELERRWLNEEMTTVLINSRKSFIPIIQDENMQYDFIKGIYSELIKKMKESLYQCYIKKSKQGVEKLNNFHLRKAANFYYESIKQEKENVEAIIKIQVNALEEEMKIEAYEDKEQQIIQEILHTIREAYQHLGREIEELEQFFKETEKQSNKMNLYHPKEFEEFLMKEGMDSYINDLSIRNQVQLKSEELITLYENYDVFYRIWKELKSEILKTYLEKINHEDLSWRIILKIRKSIETSQRIIQLFWSFHEKHKELDQKDRDIEYASIIEGISETIAIKVESLEESLELFSNSIDEVLSNMKEEFSLSKIEKEYEKIDSEIYEKFAKEILGEYPIEESEFMEWGYNYLDKEFEEGFDLLSKKLIRRYEKKEEEADKKIIRFLREHLLFEISTYEEIINYSVSKLREGKEDFTLLYVRDMDTLTQSIEEILKIYGIQFIHPNPHERFNGKTHEVLMAEAKEGFEKGEIIKTMNRGYLFNDQIILKANVIACK